MIPASGSPYEHANSRLQYWYDKAIFTELSRLKVAIERVTPAKSSYRMFFLCAFSNILKSTSKWLQKSIKPQVDPHKTPPGVLKTFRRQVNFMLQANDELKSPFRPIIDIITNDFLSDSVQAPQVDMIITSPP